MLTARISTSHLHRVRHKGAERGAGWGGAQTKHRPWIRGSPCPFLPRRSYRKHASFPPVLGTGAAEPGSVPTLPLAGELTTPRRARLPAPVSPRLYLLDKPLCEHPAGGQRAVGGPWAGSLLPPQRPPTRGTPSFQCKGPSHGLDSECPPEL